MERPARYTICTVEIMVPMYINNIIIAIIRPRYYVVVKADIPKCDDHADAS